MTATIAKAMVMMLLYMFLPVAARLACVGDGEAVEVLLGDEDVRDAGTVGVEDEEEVRVVESDEGLALGLMFF